MKSYIWKLSNEKLKNTNLYFYSNFIREKYKIEVGTDFNKIWDWSIKNPEDFWKSIWEFTQINGDQGKVVLKKSDVFYKNRFFPDAKLNYAENLLKKNDDTPAIIFRSENGFRKEISWKHLNFNVSKISNWMLSNGIKSGDTVAAYLPNIPETVIAYLATSSIGAIWSSCSPDFGSNGVIDRFSQINPKILFIGDKYFYNGKKISILDRLSSIIKKIPSIKKIVVIPYPGTEFHEIASGGHQGMELISDDFSEYKRYGSAVTNVGDLSADDLVDLQNEGFVSIYTKPSRWKSVIKKNGIFGGVLMLLRVVKLILAKHFKIFKQIKLKPLFIRRIPKW